MKTYHKNPRQITEKQFSDLKRWLKELGDLSGIVHDLNSDEIISGNQRARAIKIDACETVLVEELEKPDEQGTVALGYIIWEEKRYNYRQVRWTPEWCERGNIIANKAGGEWDFDILANEFEIPMLLDTGWEEFELGLKVKGKKKNDEQPGEVEISPELFERHDYLLFYFDNDFDWQVACERFDIKPVVGRKVGKKTLEDKGLGRVISGASLLEALGD